MDPVEKMTTKPSNIKTIPTGSKRFFTLIGPLILFFFAVYSTAADATDYRAKGQEKWVRFTFILKDSKTGKPINGRVYYQSDLASDWFHPDNTRPLLPPGTYRVVAWERHYWQSEQTLRVNPRKGLQQQIVIALDPVSSPRDDKSGSPLKVPEILSSLVITGNAVAKMPHMNASWFGQSGMATFGLFTNAWSEYPGGIGGGNRILTGNIHYYFFVNSDDAKSHFDRMRPGFKQTASKSQTVTGPTSVSLGDQAFMIKTDTFYSDGSGRVLYENRQYLVLYRNVVFKMSIKKESGLDFLITPEEILRRIRALDMQKVKRIMEPEPYPWPKVQPAANSHQEAKATGAPASDTSEEELPPGTVLLAVAGGSLVLTLGALIQLLGMGGLQNITDIRGALQSLFATGGTDVPADDDAILDQSILQDIGSLPKEPQTSVNETVIQESPVVDTVIPDPLSPGFEHQGKVWYQPPWDQGGPYWMNKADYDAMRSMLRQGRVWSDRWGWVFPEDGKAMEAQNAEAWDKYKSDTDDDIKALTDRIEASREKLAEIRDKQAELDRIEELRERLVELERQRALDNSFATHLKETWKHYEEGVNRDLDALPGELKSMALAAAREVRDTTGALVTAARDTAADIYREVTDADNYKAVGQAAFDTAKELILHPVDSSVKVGDTVKTAGRGVVNATGTAATVAVAIASDPVGFAEAALGVDNWRKVLDPDVPVGQRVCRALYGAVDTALNFASGGTKTAAASAGAGLDALKAADAASDTAKAAKGIEAGLDAAKTADAASDAARITPKLDDPARAQAWEAGRLAGQKKADHLAEALQSGDASEIKKALVECQKDKHAIASLNASDDAVKTAYNQNMKDLITNDVDNGMKQKIAQRYGVDPEDVRVFEVSNPTDKVKIGADRDFTIQVKAKPGDIVADPNSPGKFIKVEPEDLLYKDVPAKDAQAIYNRELYSKVTGEPIPTDPDKFKAFQADADKLAHNMDHVAGHRVGTESYGASAQDLETILQKSGGRFTDPEQAGQLASYKSAHLYQQAENIAKVDPQKAEALISDGMRQTTKQYDNLITPRVRALENQGIDAAVDSRLSRAVDILKKVETEGMAPSKVEALLKSQMNMTKDDAAQMLGAQLAKLHHMKG